MKHIKIIFIIISWGSGAFIGLQAQNVPAIQLSNPSFEDMPRQGRPPMGWYNCGMDGESPPDVQPGHFEVSTPAKHGSTYLGMVTRDNETWEAVGQRLSSPMQGGTCYQFRIYITHSEEYFSPTRSDNKYDFFTKPIKLRIWGGNGYCDKREMLGETELITSTDWKEETFVLKPKRDYKYIVFEAFYKTPTLFPYNGNILLDRASDLIPTSGCEILEEEFYKDGQPAVIAVNEPPTPPTPPAAPEPKPKPEPSDSGEVPPAYVRPDPVIEPEQGALPAAKPKILAELDAGKVKEGQKIRIRRLNFETDSYRIKEDMHEVLDEIYDFMRENPKVAIEIGGHTNNLPSKEYCDWLSTERARSVTLYLRGKGVEADRITFKGYGQDDPIDTNATSSGRKKNQRVEMKILSLGK